MDGDTDFASRFAIHETALTIMHRINVAPTMAGFFSAFASLAPLYGPLFGLPASSISFVFLPIALVCLTLSKREYPSIVFFVPVFSALIVVLACMYHATAAQWDFLLTKSVWNSRGDRYIDAKLLTALIFIIPQVMAAIVLVLSGNKQHTLHGVFAALAVIGAAAAVRTLVQQGDVLLRSDLLVSAKAMSNTPGYSLVNYGTLFVLGAVASLRFRHGWLLSGLLLFTTLLLSRRADAIMLVSTLVVLAGVAMLSRQDWPRYLGSIAVGFSLFAMLHNGHNIQYFSNILRAVDHRVEMLQESAAAVTDPTVVVPMRPEQLFKNQPWTQSNKTQLPTIAAPDRSLFLGAGLGSYKEVTGSRFYYPHNIFVELFIELGLIPSILIALSTIIPMLLSGHQLIWKGFDLDVALAGSCLALIVGLSLKAGEMTNVGRLMFLSTLCLLPICAFERRGRREKSEASSRIGVIR